MNRDEIFAQAKAARAEEKKKEANRGQGWTFDPLPWSALEAGKWKVFRILGVPAVNRGLIEGGNYSPKIINISMILGDNDKKFRCIWPLKSEDDTWIMWRIFDKVLAYEWDTTVNQPRYHHAASHPTIFKRIFKNNSEQPYEKGWKPSTVAVMNIIDREETEWHKENLQTRLLSKKASVNGERIFHEVGIPVMTYNMIMDTVVEHQGDWEEYDIAARKLTQNPWYEVMHMPTAKITDPAPLPQDVLDLAVDGPLTDEERFYSNSDLDRLFKITKYQKLLKNLGVFIQAVDSSFKTHYYEELRALAEKEKAEDAARKAAAQEAEGEATKTQEQGTDVAEPDIDDAEGEVVETTPEAEAPAPTPAPAPEAAPAPAAEPQAQTRTRKKAEPEPAVFSVDQLDASQYAGLGVLTAEEKAKIVGVEANGDIIYAGSEQLYNCPPPCGFKSPESFHACPKCGAEFE